MAKLKNLAKYSGIALLLTNFSSCSFQKLIPHHLTSNLTYSHNIVKPNIRINIDPTRDKAPIDSIGALSLVGSKYKNKYWSYKR